MINFEQSSAHFISKEELWKHRPKKNWLSIVSKRGTPKEALNFNFSEIGSSESVLLSLELRLAFIQKSIHAFLRVLSGEQ